VSVFSFEIQAHLPALQVVTPMLGAIFCAFLSRESIAWPLTMVVTWATALISAALLMQVLASGPISYAMGGWQPPFGIEYRVDALSGFVLMIVSWSAAITLVYARDSIRREIQPDQQAWFYCMFMLCMTGLLGIAITGDAFNAFVFLEISSLAMYTLIALGRDRRALLSSYQYLIVGTIGASFYVIGVGLLYSMTGSLNFYDISTRLAETGMERSAIAALTFMTVGISLKVALFPLHAWLPNAYAYAPSAATAFIAGTATKVAIYLLIRILFSVFGASGVFVSLPVSETLLVLSIAAMIIASLVAVFEENAKRVLAYSSVAQVGYITLGIALANQAGLTAAIVHVFNHAVMKTVLFLAIGAAVYRVGALSLSDLRGIGPRMPITMTAMIVGGFSLIGVPGTAGFISKYYLAISALEKGWWPLLFVIVVSSFIAVIYVGRLLETIWFREPGEVAKQASDPPLSMLVPIIALTIAVIWFGFDTRLTVDTAATAAANLLEGLK